MARRMWALVGAMVVLAATAGSTFAAERDMRGVFALSLGAGLGVPFGDYGDGVNVGPAGSFAAEYYVTRCIALGLNGTGFVGDLKGVPDTSDVSLTSTLAIGGVSVRFSSPMERQEPYLMATIGSGHRSIEAQQGGTTVTVSDDRFGVDLTGGVNFRVGEKWQVTTGVGYQLATKDSNNDSDILWQDMHVMVGARVLLGGRH